MIVSSDSVRDGYILTLTRVEQPCFYCGVTLLSETAFVEWTAVCEDAGDTIALHAVCAQELALHLAKDGLLAECDRRETLLEERWAQNAARIARAKSASAGGEE